MNKVIFYTHAYNAEKTLPRTIKSILSQTCENWVWHLVDNGSTDKTSSVIQEYASNDSRIIPLANKKNHVWEQGNRWRDAVQSKEDNDYFCIIDADDEYKPNFIEDMLKFIMENNIEVAACGNDFLDANTGKLQGVRSLHDSLIIEKEGFGTHFSTYHQFMRTSWGKLFAVSVLHKFDTSKKYVFKYGGDTLFTTEHFRNASRVGIIPQSLHKYYVSPASVSYKWDKERIESDRILHDRMIEFLNEKVGFISPQNKEFLYAVYFNAVKDTLKVLLNAKMDAHERLAGLIDIFTSEQTRELSAFNFYNFSLITGEREILFKQVTDWVVGNKELNNAEQFKFFAAVNGNINSESFKSRIVEVASRQPLLAGLNADFLVHFSDVALLILNKDFSDALEKIVVMVEEEQEIPSGTGIKLITLGLNLSSKLEKADYFIFFKKLQISLLIDSGQNEKAAAELADWLGLMPNDTDFQGFLNRLNT